MQLSGNTKGFFLNATLRLVFAVRNLEKVSVPAHSELPAKHKLLTRAKLLQKIVR